MKKLYSLIIISIFFLSAAKLNAATIPVTIQSFSFSPATFTAVVGDDIVFTLINGTHSVVSTSVPGGASAMASGTMTTTSNTTYTYTVAFSGTYTFKCGFHSSMVGGFTASALGVVDPSLNLLTSVYPSPFKEKVTVKYNGIESIEFMDIVGEKIKTIEMVSNEGKLEVDFDNLPAGVYFYRTYKDGVVFETRKIVKAK
jgi:plastocyanin